ncbi:MAG TPA: PEGA domain-containing protein [Sandaracinaceae bacterium LLY-WYZ-13_1]|nr:PEGA domain-containing protein [Sandaracinaceae bacterium LLY-WYZ-13_1]
MGTFVRWIAGGLVLFALVSPGAPAAAQEAETVTVRVVSTPRARVEVLGRGEVGTTPIRRLELPVGEHDFVFTRNGYARAVLHVDVREDGQTIGAELQRAGRIRVRADHLPARGATIRIDGRAVGRVPETVEVVPGRRLLEVEADGYLTFSQWVEVGEAARETVNVRLDERPPDVGAILVTADVPDAEVVVDGETRGRTPVLVEGLMPGEHTVVVRGPDDAEAEQTVEVRPSAREVLQVALLPRPEPPGAVELSSEPPGATVVVDGERAGVTPITLEALSPGAHRFELSLDGYEATERVVTVEGGERHAVSVELEEGQPRPGRIMVTADREDAFVILDGLSRGQAPITLERIAPGEHTVRVQAPGAAPYETECTIRFGETCTVEAELRPEPIEVSVTARAGGSLVDEATLAIGEQVPVALPWEGTLPPGTHALEIRAPGYETVRRDVELSAGDAPRSLSVAMEASAPPAPEVPPDEVDPHAAPDEPPEAPSPSDAAEGRFYARDAAEPLPSGRGSLALFLGWPYLAGAGVDVGLPGPVDLGLAARTFGRVTELEVHSRLGWAPVDVVGLGLWLRVSAGLGPDEVDVFGAKLDGRISLWPIDDVVVSAWIGLDVSSDDYPFTEEESAPLVGDIGRQNLARARLGGSVAWRFWDAWALNLRLEGILASSGGRRRVYGDVIGVGNPDTEMYGEIGVGYGW